MGKTSILPGFGMLWCLSTAFRTIEIPSVIYILESTSVQRLLMMDWLSSQTCLMKMCWWHLNLGCNLINKHRDAWMNLFRLPLQSYRSKPKMPLRGTHQDYYSWHSSMDVCLCLPSPPTVLNGSWPNLACRLREERWPLPLQGMVGTQG